ncbi:MAG: hypothetical protein ABI588_04365 [Arenimonas sp.]
MGIHGEKDDFDMHRDPITGTPGAHPLGTGPGAAGGAAAGAAAGAAGGPIGMAVAGAIGAVVGGLGGKAASEALNPSGEEQYWRAHYEHEPYRSPSFDYEDYAPAYRLGYENRERFGAQSFEQVENNLAAEWKQAKGESRLDWSDARAAIRAAWSHVER